MLVAAIFSRRCATEEVPGISRIVAECCSSHASATCRGDAPSRAATASRRALEASPHLKRGRAAVRDGAPTAARHERRGLVSDATRTICSHNLPKQDGTRARTTHQQKTWNCVLSNAFPARSEGYRAWPCCTHNPKVAGSNPAPATMNDEGLADVAAANPFRLPRLHPGIDRS